MDRSTELIKVICAQKDQAALLQVRAHRRATKPYGPDTEQGRSTREFGWRALGISRGSSACDSPGKTLGSSPSRASDGIAKTQSWWGGGVRAYSSDDVRIMRDIRAISCGLALRKRVVRR
jgi:hypothetical protein